MASDDVADLELLARWRTGDEEAGNTLLSRHFGAVYRFFRRKLDVDADDLAQRTFTACLESTAIVTSEYGFKVYLLGIARHQLLRFYREQARRARRTQRASAAHVDEVEASPSSLANGQQERKLLLKALKRLPLDLQITIELYYWEQMSTREIAEIVHVAPGTVKWRLSKAREQLREILANLSPSPSLLQSTLTNLDQWVASVRRLGIGESHST